eukprot:s1300_g6.t1
MAEQEAVAAAAQPEMPQGQPIARQPVQPDPEAPHVEELLQEPEEVEPDLEARSVAGVSVFSDPHADIQKFALTMTQAPEAFRRRYDTGTDFSWALAGFNFVVGSFYRGGVRTFESQTEVAACA